MNQKTHSHFLGRTLGWCAVVMGAFFAALVAVNIASANPTANPPTGTGAISVSGSNVGIGTASPADKLDVAGNIVFGYGAGSGTNGLYFVTSGGGAYLTVTYGGNMALSNLGQNIVLQSGTGNVGIGTTAPGQKLDVSGNANISGTLTVGAFTSTLSAGNVSAGTFGSNTGGGNYNFSGNVGIGTASPTNILQIGSVGATGYAGNSIAIGDGTNAMAMLPGATAYLTASGNMVVGGGTNTTNQLFLASGGNVGIGTAAPAYKLQVGAGNGDGIMIGNFNNPLGWNGSGAAPEYDIRFPAYRDIVGNMVGAKIAAIRTNACCSGAEQGMALAFSTVTSFGSSGDAGLTETMRLVNGNVGIEQSSPAYTLDVAGPVRSSSGGFVFPDGTTQTTAAGSSGQVTAAGNISAGTFGSNTGGGNYMFTGDLYLGNGANNVQLDYNPGTSVNGVNTSLLGIAQRGIQWVGAMDTSGDFGIKGGLYASGEQINGNAGVSGNLYVANVYLSSTGALDYWGGGSPYRTWMDSSATYHYGAVQDYAIHFTMDGEDSGRGFTWGQNGATPSMSVDVNGNLTVRTKITVPTIDPLYTINGKNYATYVPSMTGQKEETAGTLELGKGTDGKYGYSIDFTNLPQGSDLWLFGEATAMKDGIDGLTVSLTPSFDGNVWYEKIPAKHMLVIHAIANDASAQTVEVSYRFTAPRFDAAKWATVAPADEANSKGLIIND